MVYVVNIVTTHLVFGPILWEEIISSLFLSGGSRKAKNDVKKTIFC